MFGTIPARAGRLAVVAVAGAGLLAPLATTPATAGGPKNVLQLWSPKYMSRHDAVSKAQAISEAKRFDVVIAYDHDYPGYANAMHAANPQLKLLAYANGTFAQHKEGSRYPAAAYLHDSHGRKVQSRRFGNYLMDPQNAAWVADRIRLCRSEIAASGFDGCGLDVLGTAPLDGSKYVTARPINPRTHRPWTEQAWLTATAALAGKVRAAIRPKLVSGNGIGDGMRYFKHGAPTSLLFRGVDIGMAEVFIRDGRSPMRAYPSVASWRADVDMVADAEAHGRELLVLTKAWSAGTQAQKNQWHKFSMASFLLGAGGRTRWYFTYGISTDPASHHDWWSVGPKIGAPQGRYSSRGDGTYARAFDHGLVLVNPGSATRTVRLRSPMATLDGKRVSSVALAPHSGEVLHT